ncbi:cytoskeleton associated protein CAP Gly [Elysia marginata]|uniref:Cytoskeleton associated protein CAP Gly n=1 Tax=Elysia marginata TaxID=1093978 RepID=A0AAV4I5T3_9GAST|nr:cytoskeleton associated protein CAP Gly [Elysia marginata]
MTLVWNPALDEKQTECTCAPCKSFWKRAFLEGGDSITMLSSERAVASAVLGNHEGLLRKGDRVLINGATIGVNTTKPFQGVVQYVGLADDHLIAPEMHVGVSLHDNVYSVHNGIYKGKRYFSCPRGHGAMVQYSDVTPLKPIPKTRPVLGNSMFPSFEEVKKRRKERQEKIKEAEEKLKKEHELRQRAQMDRYARSAPPPRISPRQTKASKLRGKDSGYRIFHQVEDADDIAYKDHLIREKQRQMRQLDAASLEELQFRQMKKVFGGGEKAGRMAETLKRLHKAYEEGRIYTLAERE